MWSADTGRRERPEREVNWGTPLRNGDIQVIKEEDRPDAPNPCHPYPDARSWHPQRYYLGMWNEGAFEPMAQPCHDFDVRRFQVVFTRLEEEVGNTDPPLWAVPQGGIDQRPLFQRGYAAAFLPYERFVQEMDGSTTREWERGHCAGQDDRWLRDGHLNTGRYHPSCMEDIELLKWLL